MTALLWRYNAWQGEKMSYSIMHRIFSIMIGNYLRPGMMPLPMMWHSGAMVGLDPVSTSVSSMGSIEAMGARTLKNLRQMERGYAYRNVFIYKDRVRAATVGELTVSVQFGQFPVHRSPHPRSAVPCTEHTHGAKAQRQKEKKRVCARGLCR